MINFLAHCRITFMAINMAFLNSPKLLLFTACDLILCLAFIAAAEVEPRSILHSFSDINTKTSPTTIGNEPEHEKSVELNVESVKHHLKRRGIESAYPTGFYWLFTNSAGVNISVYETRSPSTEENDKNPNFRRILFVVYDIFGFHPNTKRVIDKLAEEGEFRIVMLDFLYGGWPINHWPLTNHNRKDFQDFLKRVGNWEHVRRDLIDLIKYYKEIDGGVAKQFGIFGFGWGAKMTVEASSELSKNISAAAIIYPSQISTVDAERVEIPMYLLPSSDEPDLIPFYNILVDKFGADNVGHHRFDDMFHGFAGTRGDFDDPLNRQRVEEVITILQKYFNQQLRSNSNAAYKINRNYAFTFISMLSVAFTVKFFY